MGLKKKVQIVCLFFSSICDSEGENINFVESVIIKMWR